MELLCSNLFSTQEFAMYEYRIQSGPLKITLVAETAYDAAVEAVRWWGRRTSPVQNHRRALEAEINVRGREGSARVCERFATFNLLAESEGEAPEMAWEKLLDLAVANSN
jgi:hypothetical protein